MSVYTELLRVGINDEDARKLAEATFISSGMVTKQDLIIAIKELEVSLAWKMGTLMVTGLLGATAIFATIVNIMLRTIK